MKRLLIFFAIIHLQNQAISQITHSISLGPDFGIPGKHFGTAAKLGLGGSLDYQLKFSAPVGLQVHVGCIKFSDKGVQNSWVTFLPLLFVVFQIKKTSMNAMLSL